VALDDTTDQLLGGSKVSVGRIRESSSGNVVDFEGDGERGVSRDSIKIPRGLEFCGGHIINRRDVTHGRRVARTGLHLFTVGEGLADTVVNKVVWADEGVRLTISLCLAVDFLDHRGVERKAAGWIAIV
jgi:hypothetical protein